MSKEFPKDTQREMLPKLLTERHIQGIQRIIKDGTARLEEEVTLLTAPGVDAKRTYIVEPTEEQREYDHTLELVPHTTIPVPSSVSAADTEAWIQEAENFIRELGYSTMRRPGFKGKPLQPYIDIIFSPVIES